MVEPSCIGPALEPGLLNEGSGGGLELSEQRRDPGREPRLLTGLVVDLMGSVSKKLEIETRLRRAGDGCKCDSVSIVLSAKDVGGLRVLAWSASAVASSSAVGLLCNGVLLDAPPLDKLLMLGVRCLVRVSLCCNHDADACLRRPGNLDGGG